MGIVFKFFQGLGIAGIFLWIALWVAMFIGWVLNIIALVHSVSGPVTTLFVLRIVGIFAFPLGGILGWVS